MLATTPQLRTPGRLAAELGVPLHRVLHILATRKHITPTARAGTLRLFDVAAVAQVRHELNAQDARRAGKGVADEACPPTTSTPPAAGGIQAELLTTAEAARLAGCGERTFWAWSRSGLAPAPVKIGFGTRPAVRYRRSDIMAWIASGCPRCDGRDLQR